MNIHEIANENSSLYKLLEETVPVTSPYSYSMTANLPSFFRGPRVEVPIGSTNMPDSSFFGQSIFAELPRHGILEHLILKLTNDNATADEQFSMGVYGPLNCFTHFELRTRDKVLLTLHPRKIIEWCDRQGTDKRRALESTRCLSRTRQTFTSKDHATVAQFLPDWTFPLPFSCFDSLKKSFDLRFSEPVYLWLFTRPTTSAISATATNLWNCKIECFYQNPNNREAARLKQEMVARGNADGIPILHWSTYEEGFNFATAVPAPEDGTAAKVQRTQGTAVNEKYDIKCPYPCFQTIVQVHPGTSIALGSGFDISGTAAVQAEQNYMNYENAAIKGVAGDTIADNVGFLRLKSLKVLGAGTDLVNVDPAYMGILGNSFGHVRHLGEVIRDGAESADMIASPSTQKDFFQVIHWNLSDDPSNQTGFISWKNIANPQIQVELMGEQYGDAIATTWVELPVNANAVHICHSYYHILSIAPDDGLFRSRIFT